MSYKPLQACEVLPLLDFEPRWMLDCGPGDGHEWEVFRGRWPGVRLLGLEPSPAAFERLQGRFPGTLMRAAAWDRETRLLLLNPNSLLQGRLAAASAPASGADWLVSTDEPVLAQCFSLDFLATFLGPFEDAFLWADVEGAELQVLQGAEKLLRSGAVRGINIEVHPWRAEMLDAHLQERGFRQVFRYVDEGTHWDALYLWRGA